MLEAQSAIGEPPFNAPGITITEVTDLTITSLATSNPPTSWPAPGTSTAHQTGTLIRLAPDQALWLGTGATPTFSDVETTDLSDAFAIINLEGPNCHHILERLIPLDLHSWQAGSAARTMMEHLSTIIIKSSDTHFTMLTPRSSAHSAWHAVTGATLSLTD